MGCGSSKVGAAESFDPKLMTPALKPASESHGCSVSVRESPSTNIRERSVPTATTVTIAKRTTQFDVEYVSSDSLTSTSKTTSEASHYGSAESKDSGIGEDAESDHITAGKSSPKLKHVADIPKEFPEAGLATDGRDMKTLVPQRSTTRLPPVFSRNKKAIEEANPTSLEAILWKRVKFADVLINELPAADNIVKRPVSRGGMAFDILMGSSEVKKEKLASEGEARKRLPPCVRNYAKHQRLTDTITHAELEEKQKAAEQRRKECEQMRLERIWAQQEKDRQVAEALANFSALQITMKTGSKSAKQQQLLKLPEKDDPIHDHVAIIG